MTGGENVQAAQEYITGLVARRIAKLPEVRYVTLPTMTSLVLVNKFILFSVPNWNYAAGSLRTPLSSDSLAHIHEILFIGPCPSREGPCIVL
jgi:hypothetical protein